MPVDFSQTLVVGISSSALYDLEEADQIFQNDGIQAYRDYMLRTEKQPLRPGTAFPLAKALLSLNAEFDAPSHPLVEVVVMSRNSPETGVRILNCIRRDGLEITRSAFTGGEALSAYISAYALDLFLSTNEIDVQKVIDSEKCAAALLYPPPKGFEPPQDQVRIAFDADAVLFSEESEIVYKTEGLPKFYENEEKAQQVPMAEGPHAQFLKKLAQLQNRLPGRVEYSKVRLSIVTARSAPAELRVIATLRHWGVYVDAAFFLGGMSKDPILKALRPHIFFDDQDHHVAPASKVVPAARVPYQSNSVLHEDVEDDHNEKKIEIPHSKSRADIEPRGKED